MKVLFVVIPLALIIVGAAVASFIWAARGGQFDDLDTPAQRMLNDDDAGRRRGGDEPPAGPPPD